MATYLILRHGSNAFNQPLCQTAVVAVLDAKSRDEALSESKKYLTAYANQRLEVIPYSRASSAQRREADEISLIENAVCIICGRKKELPRWQCHTVCERCAEGVTK